MLLDDAEINSLEPLVDIREVLGNTSTADYIKSTEEDHHYANDDPATDENDDEVRNLFL